MERKTKIVYALAFLAAFYLGDRFDLTGERRKISVTYRTPESQVVSAEQVKKDVIQYINTLPIPKKEETIEELVESADNGTNLSIVETAMDYLNADSNRYIANRGYSNYFSKKWTEIREWLRSRI